MSVWSSAGRIQVIELDFLNCGWDMSKNNSDRKQLSYYMQKIYEKWMNAYKVWLSQINSMLNN